jgi:hypothetical protein
VAPDVRIAVESWAPEYGGPAVLESREPSEAQVNLAIEVPERLWAPRTPAATAAPAVHFVDGVRRIDAWVWISSDGEQPAPGIAASYAAGLVCCDGAARLEAVEVRRAVFSAAPLLRSLSSRYGDYTASVTAGGDPDDLTLELQRQMGRLEAAVAAQAPADGLLVVDGPLSKLPTLARAVGYVKTHRRRYLPESLERVVGRLEPGQRTPLFVTTTSWSRYSWYLRLPGPRQHSWSGIVRCEAAGDLAPPDAAALADCTAVTLPGFSSVAHKDARAPQNLVPIGQLERALRHRLGDPALVFRALRAAHPGGPR